MVCNVTCTIIQISSSYQEWHTNLHFSFLLMIKNVCLFLTILIFFYNIFYSTYCIYASVIDSHLECICSNGFVLISLIVINRFLLVGSLIFEKSENHISRYYNGWISNEPWNIYWRLIMGQFLRTILLGHVIRMT